MKHRPVITKPGSSKNKRSEPNHSTAGRPVAPNSVHRSINPRFIPQIIPEKYLLNPEDFELLKKEPINGFFSTINFVQNKSTGKRYAAKTNNRQTNPQEHKFLLRELNILMKIQHPTIIHFEGFSLKDFKGFNNITIFIDYKEEGTLFDILEKERCSLLPSEFTNTKRQMILIGICRGMSLLHKNNIIHRDLKPQNILLDKDYKPYITDFGLSKIFTPQNELIQSMSTCGTYAYMAPEVIEGNNFGVKADVYAFGILMYEVVTGRNAIESMCKKNKEFNARNFMNSVLNGERPAFTEENIKPGLKKMIEKCWSNDPNERPTFSELYSKLTLNDENYYIDSNNIICESVLKCEDNKDFDAETFISTKYCFDDVDLDELFDYIDEIKNTKEDEELQALNKEIKEIRAFAEKNEKENIELKKDISKIQKENMQLKSEISELKGIIFNMKKEQPKIIQKNNCDEKEEPTEDELNKQCIEIAQKVKKGQLKSIELPQYLKKVPNSLFKGCKKLKAVKLPSSVTSIGEWAFEGCSLLTQITIPSSVTLIGDFAFCKCVSLKEITIPSSVTSIKSAAFFECLSLKQITIPSSVTSIGSSAFYKCSSLAQVTIPSFVANIDDYAFSFCPKLENISIIPCGKKNIDFIENKFLVFKTTSTSKNFDTLIFAKPTINTATIPPFIKTIKSGSFSGCSSLAQITIPSSVTSIGSSAFSGCSSLTQVTIPSSVTSIGGDTFKECSSLTQITIPSSVTSFGSFTFKDCSSLTQIAIPSSVTSIGRLMFYGCSSLAQITIPPSVTSIEDSAFRGCSSLKQITIPSSVTKILNSAFRGCSSLAEITFSTPSSVTKIESYTFCGCSSLKQITIPSSVTSIGEQAFSDCSLLTQIAIPSSVANFDKCIFNGCEKLENISIIPCEEKKIECIENKFLVTNTTSASKNFDTLVFTKLTEKTVIIPSVIKTIKSYAFFGCSLLTQITIPSSVTSIDNSTFSGCSRLTQITFEIPSSVTSIGSAAFFKCSSLTKITIPSSVTSIGSCAFFECSSLTKIAIPSSVTKIESSNFAGCSLLTQITIPSSVTEIGERAFSNCSSLAQITIPSSVTKIGERVFFGCSSLSQITIPSSLASILNDRFGMPSNIKVIKT